MRLRLHLRGQMCSLLRVAVLCKIFFLSDQGIGSGMIDAFFKLSLRYGGLS